MIIIGLMVDFVVDLDSLRLVNFLFGWLYSAFGRRGILERRKVAAAGRSFLVGLGRDGIGNWRKS